MKLFQQMFILICFLFTFHQSMENNNDNGLNDCKVSYDRCLKEAMKYEVELMKSFLHSNNPKRSWKTKRGYYGFSGASLESLFERYSSDVSFQYRRK
ncbi:hypothetical protein SNEBB_002871 [Seison nebaliae]|nr:hypothetical protein SNEBB_002871 [Seison nebaliae]